MTLLLTACASSCINADATALRPLGLETLELNTTSIRFDRPERPRMFFVAGVEGTGHHALMDALNPFAMHNVASHPLSKAAWAAWENLDAAQYADKEANLRQTLREWVANSSSSKDRENWRSFLAPVIPNSEGQLEPASFPYDVAREATSRPDLSHFVRHVRSAGGDLRMIVLQREPIGTVASRVRAQPGQLEGRALLQARLASDNMIYLATTLRLLKPQISWYTIDYDELVTYPEVAAVGLADFLGLPRDAVARSVQQTMTRNATHAPEEAFSKDELVGLNQFFNGSDPDDQGKVSWPDPSLWPSLNYDEMRWETAMWNAKQAEILTSIIPQRKAARLLPRRIPPGTRDAYA